MPVVQNFSLLGAVKAEKRMSVILQNSTRENETRWDYSGEKEILGGKGPEVISFRKNRIMEMS